MKKIMSILLVMSILVMFPITAFASEDTSSANKNTYTTYFDDGSYYVTTITESLTRSTKSGTKTTTHYNSSGEALWKASVNGSFTYTGSSVTCTSASHSVTIYEDVWYTYSQNSYKSGNKAIANVVMKRKFLGIVVETKEANLTLTCDVNGNLS